MLEIVHSKDCEVKFIKNVIELFNNIDVDSNLVLEWQELLMYILENQQFCDPRMMESLSPQERLEIFYTTRSDFAIRFQKRDRLGLGRQACLGLSAFHDSASEARLVTVNCKTGRLDVFTSGMKGRLNFHKKSFEYSFLSYTNLKNKFRN